MKGNPAAVRLYAPQDLDHLRTVLSRVGWAEPFVEGQLSSVQTFAADTTFTRVYVALVAGQVVGFGTARFEPWNRLGQIHGLVVDPSRRRYGLAASLVGELETFVRKLGGRGVFVDTPVNNEDGRRFYEALGYTHDYTMTEYYDEGLDGVTYVKFFK